MAVLLRASYKKGKIPLIVNKPLNFAVFLAFFKQNSRQFNGFL
jgi:hypothetical protein